MKTVLRKLSDILSGPEKRKAAILFALMVCGATLEMVGVGTVPAFVTLLSNPDRVQHVRFLQPLITHLPRQDDSALVLAGAVVMLLFFLVKNTYLGALAALTARYVTRRQIAIARRLFTAYVHAPYTFHLQRNTAELLRNANNEAVEVVGSVLMPGLTLLMESLTTIAILLLLLIAEPFISLLAFVLLGGATFLFIRAIRKRVMYYGQMVQDYRLRMIQTVNEALGGIKITRVLGREQSFLDAYARQTDRYAEALRYRQVMTEIPRLYLETVAMFGVLGVAALLIAQHRPVQSVVPTLSILAVAIVRMIPSLNRITASLTTIRYGRFSLDVVHADLAALQAGQIQSGASAFARRPFANAIKLDDVTFEYPGAAAPSLRGISINIPRGSVVGFVGPTGAGKTTIVDLILGLLEPTSGRILIDDKDLRDQVREWQMRIGYVPQDIFLTDDTIRRNIAFGLSDDRVDEDAVRRAVDASQLTDYVASLPLGLDTIVGERGVRLSGGQRQRIGIARALYHDPEVLILDEATSSLDNETERYVMEAVDHLRGRRTILLIAHRMTTVRSCDTLFVLRDGRLAASGRYEDLLDASGDFRRLAAAV